MQEKIIEIIVYLLEEIQTGNNANNYANLSRELISRGYTESEINFAISWVFDHFQDQSDEENEKISYQSDSVRVLNEIEKMIISPQAYGYLLQLQQLHLLSESELEFVIERAIASGSSSITVEDIKNFTAALLFQTDGDEDINGFIIQGTSQTIH